MSGFDRLAGAWLDWIVAASWQLALLICLVAALCYLLRDASPRLRHGLWLLVLLKALLPPTLTAFWGVGAWGVAPVVGSDWPMLRPSIAAAPPSPTAAAFRDGAPPATTPPPAAAGLSPERLLLVAWAAVGVLLLLAVVWRYTRLTAVTGAMLPLEEGPARVELERLAARLSIRRPPTLYATDHAASPMLFGVLRPKIVLPRPVVDRLDPGELRMVLAHELVHWRRRDTWIGWLQVVVQCLFWFHPLVWLANARIRHERECACDEQVLRAAGCDRDDYGGAIVEVLKAARGRSLVVANMVGVFERGSLLQTRLEEIMRFDPARRRFGWRSRAALAVAALVLLPMAAPGVQADDPTPAAETTPESAAPAAPPRPKTNWPTIVSTSPEIGATDVDPGLTEISVTFDRDMDVTGYSWTGGGEFFPPQPDGESAAWVDKRTCVLPVRLSRGSFYRVGVNASSYQNFRSELGVPTPTAAIYFVTTGAKRGVLQRVETPAIVEITPENGATDIDPGTKAIRVEFSTPMGEGFSWTGGGPTFPTIPEGKRARWSRDGRTCTLPVALEPGARYELGLNSFSHKNFASKWGVPLAPVDYAFQTSPANP